MHTSIHRQSNTHTHKHAHTHTQTRTHTNTHTHKHTQAKQHTRSLLQRKYAQALHLVLTRHCHHRLLHTSRVGQNRIFTPYMTVCLVNTLHKIPYIHRIYIWFWPTLHTSIHRQSNTHTHTQTHTNTHPHTHTHTQTRTHTQAKQHTRSLLQRKYAQALHLVLTRHCHHKEYCTRAYTGKATNTQTRTHTHTHTQTHTHAHTHTNTHTHKHTQAKQHTRSLL